MKRTLMLITLVVCLWQSGGRPVWAHHSFVMYDQQHFIAITGIVKTIELKNPHSIFTVTVTDDQGAPVDWTLESVAPLPGMWSKGWSETTMKVGDKVTAIGYPAFTGKPSMLVRSIQWPDGRE